MNSKINEEKKLLEQITYLTRLIQQKNAGASASSSETAKSLGNSRYSYCVGNKLVASNNNQIKTNAVLSKPVTTKHDIIDKTYCILKTTHKNKVYTAGSVQALPENRQLKSPVEDRVVKKKIGLTKSENEIADSSVSSIDKKYIHINRKKLLGRDLKLDDCEFQPNFKTNVHVNPKSKTNIYINSAKLHVTRTGDKVEKTCLNSNESQKRSSIYVNPEYSAKQNVSMLIKKASMVSGEARTESLYEIMTNKHNNLPQNNNKMRIRECKNTISKIHFNKNFIGKNAFENLKNKPVKETVPVKSSASDSKGCIVKPMVNELDNKTTRLTNDFINNKNVIPSNTRANMLINKPPRQNMSVPSNNSKDTKNIQLTNGVQKIDKLLSGLNQSYNLVNKGQSTLLNNNKLALLALKRNKLSKLVKLNRAKLIREKLGLISNSSSVELKPVNTSLKLKMVNKHINLRKTPSNKLISNALPENHTSTSKKSTVNCIGNNKLVPNIIKQPVSVLQNLINKSSELIKLSNTKLIRKRLRSSATIDKPSIQVKRQVNTTVKSPTKKLGNKNVWISSKFISKLQSVKDRKDSSINNRCSYGVSSSINNRYKYSLKNLTSKTPDKSGVLKTNSTLKNIPSAITKNVNSNCSNKIVSYPKCKSDVQKQKLSLRRNSLSSSCLVSVSPMKMVRSKTGKFVVNTKTTHKVVRGLQPINRSFTRNNVSMQNTSVSKPIISNRLSSVSRTAKSVKTKYKLIRNSQMNRTKMSWHNSTNDASTTVRKVCNLKGRVNKNPVITRQRQRNKSITIGGISYHTTKTKLRRKFPDKGKSRGVKIIKNKEYSFRVSSGGKSLKRINPIGTNLSRLKLVNRSGNLSYVSNKSACSTHFARNKVIQAKQRSIALLTKKLRKNNEPCLIFHRFGKCSGKDRGTCCKLHDKKNVAICKKFLKGICTNGDCLLSHDVGPSKMPTCKHYLAGICTRDNCPYLHVKLNSSAPICVSFLQGYCPNAEKCKKRHIDVCPEFEEKGLCSKGKSCLYPHPKYKKPKRADSLKNAAINSRASNNLSISCKNTKEKCVKEDEVSIVEIDPVPSRYYNVSEGNDNAYEGNSSHQKRVHDDHEIVNDEDTISWLKKRPRLGLLPAYIPLNADK